MNVCCCSNVHSLETRFFTVGQEFEYILELWHYRIVLVDTFPFLTLKKMSTLIYMVELIKSFLYMLLTPNCVRLRNFELVTNAIRGKTSSSPYSYNSIDIDHVKHCSTCIQTTSSVLLFF